MSRLVTTLVLCTTLALTSACRRESIWPPSPETLMPGQDTCAECRMFVSDLRFAVQRHTPAGPVEWFDDLGCLITKHGAKGSAPEGVFVHAFDAELWVRGDSGFVAHNVGVISPMGFGLLTFDTLEGAQGMVARHADAETVSLIDVLTEGTPVPSQASPIPNMESNKKN